MKKDIHPKYRVTKVTCACGNEFEVMSIAEKISVDTCSSCHAAYTGESRNVSSAGRVDKFNKKYGMK